MSMITNKFLKQGSGLLQINFDTTPINRPFEIPMKDTMDQFSFTIKSRDDPFNNEHAFGDFGFTNLEVKHDNNDNKSPSPNTRSRTNRDIEMLKENIKSSSPDRFSIDWERIQTCP